MSASVCTCLWKRKHGTSQEAREGGEQIQEHCDWRQERAGSSKEDHCPQEEAVACSSGQSELGLVGQPGLRPAAATTPCRALFFPTLHTCISDVYCKTKRVVQTKRARELGCRITLTSAKRDEMLVAATRPPFRDGAGSRGLKPCGSLQQWAAKSSGWFGQPGLVLAPATTALSRGRRRTEMAPHTRAGPGLRGFLRATTRLWGGNRLSVVS